MMPIHQAPTHWGSLGVNGMLQQKCYKSVKKIFWGFCFFFISVGMKMACKAKQNYNLSASYTELLRNQKK